MLKSQSRPFNMRMPEDQRKILVAAAQREDRSLANFMIRAALTVAAQGRTLSKSSEPTGEFSRVA